MTGYDVIPSLVKDILELDRTIANPDSQDIANMINEWLDPSDPKVSGVTVEQVHTIIYAISQSDLLLTAMIQLSDEVREEEECRSNNTHEQ